MDISPEYIKMCEKAVEIQAAWKPDPLGSVLYLRFSECTMVDTESRNLSGATWLPRQDQLQEMVIGKYTKPRYSDPVYYLIWDFYLFAMTEEEWPSLEQAWLRFVMKEKHGKIWTGEEWA